MDAVSAFFRLDFQASQNLSSFRQLFFHSFQGGTKGKMLKNCQNYTIYIGFNIHWFFSIFQSSRKFRKIQHCAKTACRTSMYSQCRKLQFFFAGNNCQVLCFTSGGGCLAKGYIYVPHSSTYMYTYLEYIRYTLEYILRPFLCGSRHATPAGICQKYVYVLQGGSQLVRF